MTYKSRSPFGLAQLSIDNTNVVNWQHSNFLGTYLSTSLFGLAQLSIDNTHDLTRIYNYGMRSQQLVNGQHICCYFVLLHK